MYIEKLDLSQTRPAGPAVQAPCADADALVARGLRSENIADIALAALLYEQALKSDTLALAAHDRAGIENSLGSALCLLAQNAETAAEQAEKLDQAEQHLRAALNGRPRRQQPLEWATTQTNLALVYIHRYALVRSSTQMFAAVTALSEALEEFQKLSSLANIAWVKDIEAYADSVRAA